MDYSKIDNIEIDGLDYSDVNDWCDAFISGADYNGVPMTEEQLDEINEDTDFVYSQIEKYLY